MCVLSEIDIGSHDSIMRQDSGWRNKTYLVRLSVHGAMKRIMRGLTQHRADLGGDLSDSQQALNEMRVCSLNAIQRLGRGDKA